MKERFVYFEKESIKEYLIKSGKNNIQKNYEFIVAVYLIDFCKIQWKAECFVGFKIKYEASRKMSDYGSVSLDDLYKLLKNQIDNDSPVDLIIAKKITEDKNLKFKGQAFQLKRIISKNTAWILNYLNIIIPQKYSKVDCNLFLILEGGLIEFKKIRDSLKTKNYPFNKVMFLTVSNNQIYIGEIWPNSGMEKIF